MIAVPTGEVTGLLGDVARFAFVDTKKITIPTLSCVHIQWDGTMLHTLATDRHRIGWASWHPDDIADDPAQDDIFTRWGGHDEAEPWSVQIPLRDAGHLIKTFKLPSKQARTPVIVELDEGHIRFRRYADTGLSDVTVDIEALDLPDVPDLRKVLADTAEIAPTRTVAYNARLLADFGAVRQRGPMELALNGPRGLTHITIGPRFVGAIVPIPMGDRDPAAADTAVREPDGD